MTDRLRCPDPACGNREEFLRDQVCFSTAVLDGRGEEFDRRKYGRREGDVRCARCGAVVAAASPTSAG